MDKHEGNAEVLEQLNKYRAEIDALDKRLVELIAERVRCTDAVGHLKAKHKLLARDHGRQKLQVERLVSCCSAFGVCPDLVQRIWQELVEAAVIKHKEIADKFK